MIWNWRERLAPRYWEVAGVLVAAASLGYSVVAGKQQQDKARKGMRLQDAAQQDAQNAAISETRAADEAMKKTKAERAPNLDVLLADQQKLPKGGQSGINAERLMLGKPSALGY